MKRVQPRLSLITGTAGRTSELVRLRNSLTQQTFRAFEWIIIDQNNDDRVTEALGEATTTFPTSILFAEPNLSRALNLGATRAQGEILGFPDDDGWYDADCLEKVVAAFSNNPVWDVLICHTLDEQGLPSISPWQTGSGRCDRFNAWPRTASTALFVRRRIFNGLGGFDPSLGLAPGLSLAGQDLDFVLRAIKQGAHVEYRRGIVVRHPKMIDFNNRDYKQKAYNYSVGSGRLMRKHDMPPWWVIGAISSPLIKSGLELMKINKVKARIHAAETAGRLLGWAGLR